MVSLLPFTLLLLSLTLSLHKRVILSFMLKERVIHICLLWCRSTLLLLSLTSKRVTLLLTLKERGIHACLVCLLWQMQFSDRIRTEDCAYDPYKPYGSTNRCPLRLNNTLYVPLTRYNFPIVYGPKTAFTIRTNRTDRQTAVTPLVE